jgi:hypothetical protein
MPKLTGSLVKYPAKTSFFWYLGVITTGSLLLLHPLSRASGAKPMLAVVGKQTDLNRFRELK